MTVVLLKIWPNCETLVIIDGGSNDRSQIFLIVVNIDESYAIDFGMKASKKHSVNLPVVDDLMCTSAQELVIQRGIRYQDYTIQDHHM